ncbi:MAG: helix-hairpin-helix domain-containing protein [Planctomycetota bacterium]
MYTRNEQITLLILILLLQLLIFIHLVIGSCSEPPGLFTQPTDFFRLDINRAGWQELDLLSGLGPFWAKKIVEHRTKYGLFKDINELKKVGLSQQTITKLEKQVAPLAPP